MPGFKFVKDICHGKDTYTSTAVCTAYTGRVEGGAAVKCGVAPLMLLALVWFLTAIDELGPPSSESSRLETRRLDHEARSKITVVFPRVGSDVHAQFVVL